MYYRTLVITLHWHTRTSFPTQSILICFAFFLSMFGLDYQSAHAYMTIISMLTRVCMQALHCAYIYHGLMRRVSRFICRCYCVGYFSFLTRDIHSYRALGYRSTGLNLYNRWRIVKASSFKTLSFSNAIPMIWRSEPYLSHFYTAHL